MSIPLSVPDQVVLASGIGNGETELAAFDSALHAAGIHNANIIEVSSIIPPEAELVVDPNRDELEEKIDIGGLHPMVVASASGSANKYEPGQELAAAIGAAMLDKGYGVNVEADGIGTDRESMRTKCRGMLSELADTRNASLETKSSTVATGQVPESGAAAAVAAAVYL